MTVASSRLIPCVALLLAAGCTPMLGLEVPYRPTPPSVVDAMLRLAAVSKDDVVYDLGSGDGRIPIAAARDFGARAVGIEIDPYLVEQSTAAARRAGLGERVRFLQEDIFTADLTGASVVALYLSPEFNERLRPKLLNDLRPGARVVSHRHPMGDWRPDREIRVRAEDGEHTVYLWVIPRR
jgi:SAM-dependent methyltransferase